MSASLILRIDHGPQYISNEFRESMKFMGIDRESIKKRTPEDNGEIGSFHRSLNTDYLWVNGIETFDDAASLTEYTFLNRVFPT